MLSGSMLSALLLAVCDTQTSFPCFQIVAVRKGEKQQGTEVLDKRKKLTQAQLLKRTTILSWEMLLHNLHIVFSHRLTVLCLTVHRGANQDLEN